MVSSYFSSTRFLSCLPNLQGYCIVYRVVHFCSCCFLSMNCFFLFWRIQPWPCALFQHGAPPAPGLLFSYPFSHSVLCPPWEHEAGFSFISAASTFSSEWHGLSYISKEYIFKGVNDRQSFRRKIHEVFRIWLRFYNQVLPASEFFLWIFEGRLCLD